VVSRRPGGEQLAATGSRREHRRTPARANVAHRAGVQKASRLRGCQRWLGRRGGALAAMPFRAACMESRLGRGMPTQYQDSARTWRRRTCTRT
jgi:hypothetical protein